MKESLFDDAAKYQKLLDPAGLLFLHSSPLSDADKRGLSHWLFAPGDPDLRTTNLYFLLIVLHKAREQQPKEFLRRVFLPWVGLINSISPHRSHVEDGLAAVGSHREGSAEDLVHQVKLYREIVSDLLDPYLTLPVACFQWIEGSFSTLEAANFCASERSKAEYLASRIKRMDPSVSILSGYNPTARNAVSHTGSHGVQYGASGVIFRDIERGPAPRVKMTLTWTAEELSLNLYRAWECIVSIDMSQQIFGFDCLQLILGDWELLFPSIHYAVSSTDRAMLRESIDERISEVRARFKQHADSQELGVILNENLAIRSMPRVDILADGSCLLLKLPELSSWSNDRELGNVVLGTIRYLILARSIFSDLFAFFEVGHDKRPALTVRLKGSSLDEYAEESAGLLDLLNEAEVQIEGSPINIKVDFERAKSEEIRSLGERFPRR